MPAACTGRARSSSYYSQGRFLCWKEFFSPRTLLLIFFIALLVFGPKKLPELGKGIGAGIRALKDGIKDPLTEPGKNVTAEPRASHEN